VSRAAAEDIYRLFVDGALSPAAMRIVGRVLQPGLDGLDKQIEEIAMRGTVFAGFDRPLPVPLPRRKRRFTLADLPLADVLSRVGLTVEPDEWGTSGNQALKRIAPFLEYYYDRDDSPVNRWLRRHLQWLGASL
jgi:hypothetical protein